MDDRPTDRHQQIARGHPSKPISEDQTENGTRTGYLALARLVAAFHGAYSVYAMLGGFLARRFPALLWPHIAAAAWAFGTLAFDWGCPVTPLEKLLRERAGTSSYEEGFVQHYFTRTTLSPKDARRLHVLLALALLVVNAFAYRSRLGIG